jgi:hypothetical protein
MSTDPAIDCIREAMGLLLKELKAAQKSESKTGSRQEEAFEDGKTQALAFALQLLLHQVERTQLYRDLGRVYANAKKYVEEQGFGDFGLEEDSDI